MKALKNHLILVKTKQDSRINPLPKRDGSAKKHEHPYVSCKIKQIKSSFGFVIE